MNGIILSDSLMLGCPNDALEQLKFNYGLTEVDVRCFPGFTTGQLIGGNGEIHSILQQKTYDYIFLVSGSFDFNIDNDDC